MKRSIFGAAVVSAVTLSFCAQAQESPVFMQAAAPATDIKNAEFKCNASAKAVTPMGEDRGSLAFFAAPNCDNKTVARATGENSKRSYGYATGGNDRGQIVTGDADRGSLFSFFKADETKKAANKKITAKTKARNSSRSGGKASSGKYGGLIASYAKANGIPVSLARAVVRVESNFRANARGAAGEIGLMQVKLATARMMGYRGSAKGLYNPETNIKYGMKYLGKARKLSGGTTCGTILKYNAGHGAKRMNPISARYCSKVKRYM